MKSQEKEIKMSLKGWDFFFFFAALLFLSFVLIFLSCACFFCFSVMSSFKIILIENRNYVAVGKDLWGQCLFFLFICFCHQNFLSLFLTHKKNSLKNFNSMTINDLHHEVWKQNKGLFYLYIFIYIYIN